MSLLAALARKANRFAIPFAQQYAEGNMLATVLVTRGGTAAFDPVTGKTTLQGAVTVYQGPGRVYTVSGGPQLATGDEPTYYSNTEVSIPVLAPRPQIDDAVLVLTHPDPALAGRPFRVTDVAEGGQLPAVHRMSVTGIQPSPQWSAP